MSLGVKRTFLWVPISNLLVGLDLISAAGSALCAGQSARPLMCVLFKPPHETQHLPARPRKNVYLFSCEPSVAQLLSFPVIYL